MQKEYCVDKQLKKILIDEMKVMQRPVMKKRLCMYYIGVTCIWLSYFVVTFLILMQAIEQFQMGNSADGWAILSLDIFVFAIALILSLIPIWIKDTAYKKYMWKWCSRKNEIVQLRGKSIAWMREDNNLGKYYWEHQILYKDIKRIEYSRKEKILYVYGYMSGKEWDSPKREACFDTFEVDRTIDESTWMTLPAYFENFDDLKNNLCNLSGLAVIEK